MCGGHKKTVAENGDGQGRKRSFRSTTYGGPVIIELCDHEAIKGLT